METDEIVESCGNVFEDLGLEDADSMAFKTDLIIWIHSYTEGFTQVELAKMFGTYQSNISKTFGGKLFPSSDTLIKWIGILGYELNFTLVKKDR